MWYTTCEHPFYGIHKNFKKFQIFLGFLIFMSYYIIILKKNQVFWNFNIWMLECGIPLVNIHFKGHKKNLKIFEIF